MPSGTVKWFNELRGVGVIHPDDGSRDVVIGASEFDVPLKKGQKLSYDLVHDKAGKPSAVNIKPS